MGAFKHKQTQSSAQIMNFECLKGGLILSLKMIHPNVQNGIFVQNTGWGGHSTMIYEKDHSGIVQLVLKIEIERNWKELLNK